MPRLSLSRLRISRCSFFKSKFETEMLYERGEYYKTGTLRGISTRVGYIENPEGKIYRYVVLMNTPGKSADRIVDQLRKILQ